VRHVFGRLKGIEAHDKLWRLELTKSGLTVRQRCHHKVDLLGFDRLCSGGGVTTTLPNGEKFTFTLVATGLEVRQGKRKPKLVDWEKLANLGRTQMEMFPSCVPAEVV
jgi:hypothetical protein